MIRLRWLIAFALAAGLQIGCDSGPSSPSKPNPTPAPTTAPSTQPDQTTALSTPAPATQPATSELMIDGHVYKFPVAKLRVGKSQNQVVARLYTDDPKAAWKMITRGTVTTCG